MAWPLRARVQQLAFAAPAGFEALRAPQLALQGWFVPVQKRAVPVAVLQRPGIQPLAYVPLKALWVQVPARGQMPAPSRVP